jgi:hypothetical protein
MNLAVFDIDGTLVKYHLKRNDQAYVRAVHEIFGLTIQDSWSGYVQSTDSGILDEIAQKQFGRNALEKEMARFKKSMVKWLETEYASEPFEAHAGPGRFGTAFRIMKIGKSRWEPAIGDSRRGLS